MPVNGGAPAGASAAWSREIPVLRNGHIVMQKQVRVMLTMVTRLVHEKTAANAAAARLSAAGEALRELRLPCNARGGLADGEVLWAPLRPLVTILAVAADAVQPRVALESNGAAPEYEALGELGLLQGDRKAVESEELRAVAAACWRTRRRARSRS